MPIGLYISVPFCRTKCSFCNFASDVFSRAVFQRYTDRVRFDLEHAGETAQQMGGQFEREVDSIYLGGGTPTILDIDQLQKLFVTISQNFEVQPGAEITVECAPGTLTPAVLESFHRCGVNRVSLGVQSFVDEESRSVGRLHTREIVMRDLVALRQAGISDINIDLIAGLPHQTTESWEFSLNETIACGAPHVSVYMLEVDEDSRLGRELMAGGTKYHAHFVPDEDLTADLYERACERLNAAGIQQYEISNFARECCESRHNLKYWTRQPYLGFGVDAHSMLQATGAKARQDRESVVGLKAHASTAAQAASTISETAGALLSGDHTSAGSTVEGPGFSRAVSEVTGVGFSPWGSAVRFATADSLETYMASAPLQRTPVSSEAALEECFFLGLRLNQGLDLHELRDQFGDNAIASHSVVIQELIDSGLLEEKGSSIFLTRRGRLLSNEVFEKFITVAV